MGISIHAPRVGSDSSAMRAYFDIDISIHAPRVGSDRVLAFAQEIPVISIHAPRVGSDGGAQGEQNVENHFNPRSPCGERRLYNEQTGLIDAFQSTLPVWGATVSEEVEKFDTEFQSTLPVWGATKNICVWANMTEFQSTLPVWGATGTTRLSLDVLAEISIHAPRVGSDRN